MIRHQGNRGQIERHVGLDRSDGVSQALTSELIREEPVPTAGDQCEEERPAGLKETPVVWHTNTRLRSSYGKGVHGTPYTLRKTARIVPEERVPINPRTSETSGLS
jgi:hypothetical protein